MQGTQGAHRHALVEPVRSVDLDLDAAREHDGSVVDCADGRAADLPSLPNRVVGDGGEVCAERLDLDLQRRRASVLTRVARAVAQRDELLATDVNVLEVPLLEALADPVERVAVELPSRLDVRLVARSRPRAARYRADSHGGSDTDAVRD